MPTIIRFDLDEVYGSMAKHEAVALGLPCASLKELATNLPRRAITLARYRYPRQELLEHFRVA